MLIVLVLFVQIFVYEISAFIRTERKVIKFHVWWHLKLHLKTVSLFLWIIHRPHHVGFSLELLFTKEIAPNRPTNKTPFTSFVSGWRPKSQRCISKSVAVDTSRGKWLRLCLQDVRGRLLSAQSSVQQLRKQLSETDLAKRDAEQRNQALQRERDAALRERETSQREKDRVKQERDTLARFADGYITFHSLLLIPESCSDYR